MVKCMWINYEHFWLFSIKRKRDLYIYIYILYVYIYTERVKIVDSLKKAANAWM